MDKKIYNFLLSLILLPVFVVAQTRELDSLKQIIRFSKVDTLQIKAAIKIGDKTINSKPDTANVYLNQVLNQCNELLKNQTNKTTLVRLKCFKANALHGLGIVNHNKSNYIEAIKLYQQSLTLREEIGDKKGIATSLNNLASIYSDQGQISQALDYHNRSLKISEEIDEKTGIAKSLNNLAIIYSDQGQIPQALEYHTRSLKINEEIGDKKGIAKSLNNLALIYEGQGQLPQALDYFTRSLKIKEEIGDKKGIAVSLNNLANIYINQGQIPRALDYYTSSLKIREELGDKSGVASSLNNLALIYSDQGQISQALDYHNRSLKINEEIADKKGIAMSLNNLAIIYKNQGQIPQALEYHTRSLKINEEIGDKKGIAKSLNNLATIYTDQGQIPQALDYFTRSLKIKEEIGDKSGIASSLNGLANIKLKQDDDTSALRYGLRSLEVAKGIGYPERIKESAKTLHEVYVKQKNYTAALEVYKLYIVMRDSVKNEENQKKSLQNKMQYEYEKTTALQKAAFEKTQDSIKLVTERKMALQALDFEYAQKQAQAKSEEERKQLLFEEKIKRNTIENDFKQKQSILKAEQERKEVLAKAEQEKKDALTQKEKEKQRLILFSVIAGLLLVAVFALFMYNRFKKTQQQKLIIEAKEKETQHQKEIIEEKQKEILDSINYAKRIQYTLLAHDQFLKHNLNEHFTYFNPKDIVSGDFYWATKQNEKFYLAVCDSTGHGVPGAFMSLLNIGFLSEAINEKGIEQPNEVFDYVRERLILTISKEGQKDGFDGILLCIDKTNNKITYAAANNAPILITKSVTSSEVEKSTGSGLDFARPDNVNSASAITATAPDFKLIELPADRMPVGIGERKENFKLHTIEAKPGDIIYLYTDGYADQFGGPKGKKFKYKPLNELLLAHHQLPLSEQQKQLKAVFENWKGDLEQVDDVCVIGVRV